ncbi:MAG: glycerophosphodiester phosphodiesterase [Clostridia bacterium]|nr:glycerophosphodiester phosphodiesterase [Clostridia bacterium]
MIKFVIFLISAVIVIGLFYILTLKGRVGFADWEQFKGYYFAHRGLHNNSTAPENSMEAFRRAKEKGYGAELDVHLMSDGNLAVIHDSSLLRTAGVDVKIENLTKRDLKNYYLEGTAENIPTLNEVLALFDGKAPLIIELKSDGKNFPALCNRVCEELKSYKGAYCIESFDPRCIYWFAKNCPDVIRGQLSENYFRNKNSKVPFVLKLLMTGLLTNFLTKPDFIAYRFRDRSDLSYRICMNFWKMQGVGWTITDQNDMESAQKENIFPIFEKFNP